MSLNSVRNELEVRNQDFVALLNTANSTENKFEFSVRAFVAKLQYQQNQTKLEIKLMQDEMQKVRTHQNQTFTHLHENLIAIEGIQNLSSGKLDLEIHNMSNRENDNSLMKLNFNALRIDHSNLENYTKMLEQEVTSLRHLKGVTDLQTVLNVRNETNILRKELKITNNSLNSIRNEAEARKQDFVALLKKADSTEHKLDLSVKAFDDKLEYQQNQTRFEMKLMQDQMQKLGKYENQTLKNLRESLAVKHGIQNVSVGKLDMEINNMSNRTALTSCVHTNTKVYTGGSKILFSSVKTRFGISDSIVTALGSSGKFKREKPGLYLISAFLMTDSTGYVRFDFFRNTDNVVSFFPSVNSGSNNYQTSTFLILQYLDINDFLYITPENSVNMFGSDIYSCISFLQLTNS